MFEIVGANGGGSMSEFNTMINRMEQEILALKTSKVKTSGTLAIQEQSVALSLPLTLNTLSGQVYSSKQAVITLKSSDEGNFLSSLYLGMTGVDNRVFRVNRRYSDAGVVKFVVIITAGNATDWQTLYGGGSVTVSFNANIRTTSECSLSLAYEEVSFG